MVKNKKPKLNNQQYLEKDGIACPFCGKEGGLEGYHSFDYYGQEACLNVVCGYCGEYHVQVFSFDSWEYSNAKNDLVSTCPECGADASEEYIENLIIEGGGVVRGEFTCPECDTEKVAIFKLSRWEKIT